MNPRFNAWRVLLLVRRYVGWTRCGEAAEAEAVCTSSALTQHCTNFQRKQASPIHSPPLCGGDDHPSWRAPPPDPGQGLRPLDHAGAGLRLRLSDSVKARTPGGLPSPAHLSPVHPSCEGRATAYGWATKPGALGKTRAGGPRSAIHQHACA